MGHQKGSNFPSVYTFLCICTITLRRKKSKFAKILGHQKGSNFPSVYTFLHLHHHPTAKKIQIWQNLGASKRVKFWLSGQCFYICSITLRQKKIQIRQNLGAS